MSMAENTTLSLDVPAVSPPSSPTHSSKEIFEHATDTLNVSRQGTPESQDEEVESQSSSEPQPSDDDDDDDFLSQEEIDSDKWIRFVYGQGRTFVFETYRECVAFAMAIGTWKSSLITSVRLDSFAESHYQCADFVHALRLEVLLACSTGSSNERSLSPVTRYLALRAARIRQLYPNLEVFVTGFLGPWTIADLSVWKREYIMAVGENISRRTTYLEMDVERDLLRATTSAAFRRGAWSETRILDFMRKKSSTDFDALLKMEKRPIIDMRGHLDHLLDE